tara:strand:- start:554 stop:1213 length:660 start_codon:yes stop_codon:yes gene_type:complete
MLGLLFSYSRYKHDAIVRVYADEYLVDELCLSDNIDLKLFNGSNIPKKLSPTSTHEQGEFTRVIFFPEKLFMFEIEEKYLTSAIRIEVENNHNNYTNGFMSKYAHITFHQIFLIPKCLLDVNKWLELLDRSYKHTPPPDDVNYWPPRHFDYNDIIVRHSSNHWAEDFLLYQRGGSFTIDIPLYRKHNIPHLRKLRPGRIWTNKEVAEILWVYKLLNTHT